VTADLLERNDLLAALASCASAAAAGQGGTVLVSGEAGIGKTSLLERFAAGNARGRVLWGGCESLATPRPLGPLQDVAAQAGSALRSLLARPHDPRRRLRRRPRRARARADADAARLRGRPLGRRGDARPRQVRRQAHPSAAGAARPQPPRRHRLAGDACARCSASCRRRT
jgi:predicted ATPase